jgi:hypothetical protein
MHLTSLDDALAIFKSHYGIHTLTPDQLPVRKKVKVPVMAIAVAHWLCPKATQWFWLALYLG